MTVPAKPRFSLEVVERADEAYRRRWAASRSGYVEKIRKSAMAAALAAILPTEEQAIRAACDAALGNDGHDPCAWPICSATGCDKVHSTKAARAVLALITEPKP